MSVSIPLLQFGRCSLPHAADYTIQFTSLAIKGEFVTPASPATEEQGNSVGAGGGAGGGGKKYYRRHIEMLQVPLTVQANNGRSDVEQQVSEKQNQQATTKFTRSFPFAHAVRCPTRHGTYDREQALVKVQGTMYEMPRPASSVVLVTPDGKVLVTQRAAHMRTFPSKWVCPGGGVDDAETFEQAAVREVQEEVGVTVAQDQLNFLGCWESVFPPEPTPNIPTRQHFVSFYACSIPEEVPVSSLTLQEEECQAAVWIPFPSLPECIHHLTSRQAPPLKGLSEGSVISEGMYFFICEAGRRFHEGTLKAPPVEGAGTKYAT